MSQSTWYILGIVIYSVGMFGIGYALRNVANKSLSEFGMAGGRFGTIAITVISVGSWVGAGGLIGLCAWSYDAGISQWWGYSMAYLINIPFIIFFLTRVRRLNFYTIPDFFAKRYPKYNSAIKIPTALLFLIRNATTVGMQLSAIAFLLSVFFKMDRTLALILSAILVLAYTATSGLLSVMVTNIVQSVFQTITPPLALIIILWKLGGWAPVHDFYAQAKNLQALNLFGGVNWWKDVFYYFVSVGLFFLISDQGDWQRISAAKDEKTAFKSFMGAIVMALPFLLIPCYLGVTGKVLIGGNYSGNVVLYEIIRQVFSPPVGAILIVGALSTIMSCASSYMFAGAMNISHDIVCHLIGSKVTEKQEIFWAKIGTIICCCLGLAGAIWIEGILDLWQRGIIIATCGLLVPYMFAWFSKWMNTEGALTGMILGGSTSLIWSLLGNPYSIDAVWIGIPLSLVGCIVGRLLTPPPTEEEVQATYYFGKQFKGLSFNKDKGI